MFLVGETRSKLSASVSPFASQFKIVANDVPRIDERRADEKIVSTYAICIVTMSSLSHLSPKNLSSSLSLFAHGVPALSPAELLAGKSFGGLSRFAAADRVRSRLEFLHSSWGLLTGGPEVAGLGLVYCAGVGAAAALSLPPFSAMGEG